jgi:D-serine deaminase-like pyridoxal phosphate-dependent protein
MPMDQRYVVENLTNIPSPSLLFFVDVIRANIRLALAMAGSPERLRPHVKTHKTKEIAGLLLAAGVTKHKCATLAEAEMLAQCGARDVLLAYPIVGPNCDRLARLVGLYPSCRFSVLADHPDTVASLSRAMDKAGQQVGVFMDLDVGQHRTGIAPGSDASLLYEKVSGLAGLRAGGFHVYDGHNHQEKLAEREAAVRELLNPVMELRTLLEKKGHPVPRVVFGGTPTFPVFCRLDYPGTELSPGTFVLHDCGYGDRYGDLADFTPAALLLTRVISRPTASRVTLDLGYKAVASDPPAGKRCKLLGVADYQAVLQSEEHLVIETPHADRFRPGDAILAVPTHICPTVALHQHAFAIEKGKVIGQWRIASRDRTLTFEPKTNEK